jgi:hypothetical protein
MEEEELDRTQWRTRFGGVYGLAVRQTKRWIHENISFSAFEKLLILIAMVTI